LPQFLPYRLFKIESKPTNWHQSEEYPQIGISLKSTHILASVWRVPTYWHQSEECPHIGISLKSSHILASVWRVPTYSSEALKKLHGLSPRANYTDRATAACRRSDYQRLRLEGATWSAWRIPTAVFSDFLDSSRYFSIK
jgi:hypothetical protein